MGAGASAGIAAAAQAAPDAELKAALAGMPADTKKKLMAALQGGSGGDSSVINVANPTGSMKVMGMPVSGNSMPMVLAALDTGAAKEMTLCNLMNGDHKTPEFEKINPWKQAPAATDGDLCIAEGNAVLRYIANKYAPSLYGGVDPAKRAKVDWALDWINTSFNPNNYGKIWYGVAGFAGPPDDQKAENEKAVAALELFCKVFLSDTKFVGGDTPTIADYKLAIHCFNLEHPAIKQKTEYENPARIKTYIKDFLASSANAKILFDSGGMSCYEFLTTKFEGDCPKGEAPTPAGAAVAPSPGAVNAPVVKGTGKMKVYGPPFSSNTTPAAVLGLDTGAAEFVVCKLWEGEHKTEPMMKINPMGACPLADDEGVNMAEGNTILRYIASKYAPELYGGQDAAVKSKIDWVLDWEATSLNPKYNKIWPGVVGFADPPEDQKAANEAFTADLAIFEKAFLSNSKFITGDTLSIADYRVALRCFNLHNPTIKEKTGFECSERIQKYISDFEASSKNAKDFLRSGHDGFNANDFTTNIPFKK